MVREGNELRPASLPFQVIVGSTVEHPDGVRDALDMINGRLAPVTAFDSAVDYAEFDRLWPLAPELRTGTVLVWQGFVGSSGLNDAGEVIDDRGGIVHLLYDGEGLILAADIVINSDYGYDRQTVRDVMAHEAGHVLGLAHDGSSMDQGSCMSAPPEYDCSLTDADVELFGP